MTTTIFDRILFRRVNPHPLVRGLIALLASAVFGLAAVMPGFRLFKYGRRRSNMDNTPSRANRMNPSCDLKGHGRNRRVVWIFRSIQFDGFQAVP
jgi:hypothetical protein